jgi:hypothetical protein
MANVGIIFSSSSSTGLVYQARQAVGSVPSPPFNDHGLGDSQPLLDLLVPLPLARQQHDAGAQGISLGGRRRTRNAFQSRSLFDS